MNEDREVLPEIPGLYGDQKEKYGNFELKIIYKSISEKEMSKLIKIFRYHLSGPIPGSTSTRNVSETYMPPMVQNSKFLHIDRAI